MLDIWTFTSWFVPGRLLSVIGQTEISAKLTSRVSEFSAAFADSFNGVFNTSNLQFAKAA